MQKYFAVFLVLSLLVVTVVSPAFAYHQKDVLGVTDTMLPQTPPTSTGPGLLLPDSPLFFLDQFKQSTRILFAFSPEEKAKVYTNIAGERMAELRFMIAKQNKTGIDTDLNGVSDNMGKAAAALTQAKLTGRDVTMLAQEINKTIKDYQRALDLLTMADNREIKFKAKAAQEALLTAKLQVEDVLPQDQLAREVAEDIKRAVEAELTESLISTKRIEQQMAVLGAMAPVATPQATLKQ